MAEEDWVARWREGRTGFHEGAPNELLVNHRARLTGRRVLVPLCGRSEDLAYLAAHGHEVVGVELAEQAVREFFALHALEPAVAQRGPLVEYRSGAITLLAGDFFEVTRDHVGAIDAYYDRAALIALTSATRPRYAAHVRSLVPVGAPGIVLTTEYDQALTDGPPWSVPEAELRALYAGSAIELLEERAMPAPRLVAVGAAPVERCFAIRLG